MINLQISVRKLFAVLPSFKPNDIEWNRHDPSPGCLTILALSRNLPMYKK